MLGKTATIRKPIKKYLSTIFLLPVLLLGMAFQSASAETYFSIDGSKLNLQSEGSEEDASPGGIRFRIGWQISPRIDVEGHLGFSFTDETEDLDGLSATYFSGFLKGYVPLGRASALYGLVGWSAITLTQEIGSNEFTEDRGGFSWGFGMETQLTKNADLTGDFVNYINSDGAFENISAVNVGIKLYF